MGYFTYFGSGVEDAPYELRSHFVALIQMGCEAESRDFGCHTSSTHSKAEKAILKLFEHPLWSPLLGFGPRVLRVADVGDGLCCWLRGADEGMIIDCGGDSGEDALAALRSMSLARTLVLTHLHRDHYAALIEAAKTRQPVLDVEKLILPAVPEFVDSKRFRIAFAAMMARVSQAETGLRVYDAAQWLAAVNQRGFERRMVSENDTIELGDRRLRVLWPPTKIHDEGTLLSVRRALKAFEEALEHDEVLREAHEQAADEPVVLYPETKHFTSEDGLFEPFDGVGRKVPESTRKAEKALGSVANRLSLAFHDGSDLLVWGDQKIREIKAVGRRLEADGLTRFNVMLTPHHGTHWPSRLRNPQAVVAVTSAGKRRIRQFKKGLIPAEVHRSTYLEGTIETPVGW